MKFEPPSITIKITIEAPLNPSEDPEKVSEAIRNLVEGTDLSIERQSNQLIAKTEDPVALSTIYEKLRSRQSLSVVRKNLRRNVSKNSTWICFNKQAAYVKTINLCEDNTESPLGAIKMTIRTKDPEKFIDWLAPQLLD